jgi:glycosyltransferase involved in cell wall biosynthesis
MNRATRSVLEAEHGPTVVPPLPVELDHFTLKHEPPGDPPVVGFSGYGYRSGRKGSGLAEMLVKRFGDRCRFQASGRKWPCPTKKYRWKDMPGFFRALDVYVCTALIEGGPMTTLEALATGIPVVVPDDVGIHPELPEVAGIRRYRTGDADDLARALDGALTMGGEVDREALRAAVGPHSVEAWCEGNRSAFSRLLAEQAP